MTVNLDIMEFAERVELFCDFFLTKLSNENSRDGSDDIKVIEKLKQDAADLQFDRISQTSTTITGLDTYMRGIPPREQNEARTRST